MKPILLSVAFCLASLQTPAAESGELLTNTAEVVSAIKAKDYGRRFEFTARVTTPLDNAETTEALAVEDDVGALAMLFSSTEIDLRLRSGDLVRVRGFVDLSQFTPSCARLSHIDFLSHGDLPAPRNVSIRDIVSGKCDHRVVTAVGSVRDVFVDDVDPSYCALVLDSDTGRLNVMFPATGVDLEKLDSLLNAKVSVSGLCLAATCGQRRMTGRHLNVQNATDIRVLEKSKDSVFDVQNLEDLTARSGEEVAALGRRRIFGRVLATWGKNQLLIKYLDKQFVRIELAHGDLPRYGDLIEAVGFPETDLYNINLSRAAWRKNSETDPSLEPAQDVSAADILLDKLKRARIDTRYNGKVVRLQGTIRNSVSFPKGEKRIFIESDGFSIPADLSSLIGRLDDISIGCKVAVSGVCVIDIENWRPNTILPRIKGFFVVPRISDDVQVLSRPSWWTAGRLLAAIGALLTILVGILLWNTSLRRKVEKRSRELAQETVARVTSELKVGERTRLAMELHDSIVQSLTGVSMEIRTADRIADTDNTGMHQHLSLAVKTLDSCRKDLRNCLWDLRNLTLEDEDVNDAIRRTLAPHVGDTKLAVRFNVPRELFCDNTAHTILRIIRELAINAVQHGKATSIKVAGNIEDGKLLFSVRDNGCGFDPANVPGMAQGHFGLQGIRDRIETFEGEMSVLSSPDKGTKVTISLNLPKGTADAIA